MFINQTKTTIGTLVPQPQTHHYKTDPPRGQTNPQPKLKTTRPTTAELMFFCYFCSIPGHVTKDCRKLRRFLRDHQVSTHDSYSYPVVNNTSSHTAVPNTPWMWDTGASNHTNNNNNQMHVLSEYGGPDEIVLGDGKTIPITHIG